MVQIRQLWSGKELGPSNPHSPRARNLNSVGGRSQDDTIATHPPFRFNVVPHSCTLNNVTMSLRERSTPQGLMESEPPAQVVVGGNDDDIFAAPTAPGPLSSSSSLLSLQVLEGP